MGWLGIVMLVVGLVVEIVAWIKKRRGFQVLGALLACGGIVLLLISNISGCMSMAY